ncbi:hypothetical protein ABZ678_14850 [Streptomyces hirsutus]|uniref:hypothetical protein n=1 Tax=Streptomyces hirsutus TaxID=35620 RepID=UPI0033F72384
MRAIVSAACAAALGAGLPAGAGTPATVATKMDYKDQQGLAGTFFWELSGGTANGGLIGAIR